jgi:hypothetical protein
MKQIGSPLGRSIEYVVSNPNQPTLSTTSKGVPSLSRSSEPPRTWAATPIGFAS